MHFYAFSLFSRILHLTTLIVYWALNSAKTRLPAVHECILCRRGRSKSILEEKIVCVILFKRNLFTFLLYLAIWLKEMLEKIKPDTTHCQTHHSDSKPVCEPVKFCVLGCNTAVSTHLPSDRQTYSQIPAMSLKLPFVIVFPTGGASRSIFCYDDTHKDQQIEN